MSWKSPIFVLLLLFFVSTSAWEDISMVCPHQCACQYAELHDLSVARWIDELGEGPNEEPREEKVTNEVFLESFKSDKSMYKAATCYLQSNVNFKDFVVSLPQDVQVLVLLHMGDDSNNLTVYTNDLRSLPDLTILELRGTLAENKPTLLFNQPLPTLQHANFEALNLAGSEFYTRRPDKEYHPSEHFDYVPESERSEYNVSLELAEEIEIVPYEVYKMEQRLARVISFYGWTDLRSLRIHDCQLDELHWEIFDGLESLHHLSLEHNGIKVIPPFAFFGTPSLKTLSLARNEILDLQYRSLAGLLELQTLDLSYNNLTKLSELTFPPFPSLVEADLRHNPIRFTFPATFGVMNGTRRMYMGSEVRALSLNGGDHFEHLGQMQKLVLLNASANVIGLETFKGLGGLKSLKIRGIIRRVEFDAFSEMMRLKELSLSHCQIEEISMDSLYGVRSLEVIDLSNNRLEMIPYGLFEDQRNLREVYLENNELSELPKNFFEMQSLKLARLTGNPWICSCEMVSWRQGITNKMKVRREKKKTCILDIEHPKAMNCQETDSIPTEPFEYVFNNKMSPRCDGGPEPVRGRSVYYALRKDLHCSTKKISAQRAQRRRQQKQRLLQKQNQFAEKEALLTHPLLGSGRNPSPADPVKQQRQKQITETFANKVARTKAAEQKHVNSLHFQLAARPRRPSPALNNVI